MRWFKRKPETPPLGVMCEVEIVELSSGPAVIFYLLPDATTEDQAYLGRAWEILRERARAA